MQQIEALITVQIPDDFVMVEKTRLREIEDNIVTGKLFTMKDFCERTNRSAAWLKKNILMNPYLINKLNIEKGGWVYYPASQSDRWLFKASGMINFIENDLGKHLGGIK